MTAPTALQVTSAAYDRMSFTFSCGGNADNHSLYAALSSGGAWRFAAVSTACTRGQLRAVADIGIQPGQSYCWKVRAENDTNTAESAQLCRTVPTDDRPVTAPGFRVLEYTQTLVSFEIEDRSDNEGGFRIWGRRPSQGEPWTVLHTHRWPVERHTGTGVLPRINDNRFAADTAWEFKAESFKEFSPASAFSPVIRITTLPFPPFAPNNLRIVEMREHSALLAWDAAARAEWYTVHAAVEGYTDQDQDFAWNETTGEVVGLGADADVCFSVQAKNRGGSSVPSNTVCGRTLVPQPTEHTAGLFLEPDVPYQGVIPFNGAFPILGSNSGTVLDVTIDDFNSQDLIALIFINPAATTAACDVESARVVVTRGQSLGPDGFAKLYGTRTPQLPILLRACSVVGSLNIPHPHLTIRWLGF